MKKLVCLLGVLSFAWPGALWAQGRAAEIVADLSAEFQALKGYEIEFEVAVGEYRGRGSYSVSGSGYHLLMGDAEVFCDGTDRFEVSHSRKEVTVAAADTASRNILDNPVHAFDFLDSEYVPSLLREQDGEAVVLLRPVSGGSGLSGDITLTVSVQSPLQPKSIVYEFDGEQVVVRILRFALSAAPPETFDRAACTGYEWIDFR